jgi:hypothetical protein
MTPRHDAEETKALSRRLLEHLRRRAAMSTAIGILAAADRCRPDQARATLRADHGRAGEQAEAARVVAVSEANAEPRNDPDWR